MTKSIQQIKQDFTNLESKTVEIATELERLYQDYLNLLTQSVKQQLILASYQICTQFYPQSFLELSLSEKQNIQQTIRRIGIEAEPTLLSVVQQKELEPEPLQIDLMAELIKNLPKSASEKSTSEVEIAVENENSTAEIDLAKVKAELAKIEFIEIDDSLEANSELDLDLDLDALEDEDLNDEELPKEEVDFSNPEHLILWHQQIERGIKKTLEDASRKVNQRLQESAVIPDRIPSKIINVAMQADGQKRKGDRKLQNTPNILNLAVESGGNSKSKSAKKMLQVSLLRLRLTELEFCDPILNAKRGKIRTLVSQINQLNSKYRAIQKEASIAEAQAAWRSSWYED